MAIRPSDFIECDQCENLVPKWFAKYAGPRSKPFGTQGPEPRAGSTGEDLERKVRRLEVVMCRRCLGEADEYPASDDTKEAFEARRLGIAGEPKATVEWAGKDLVVRLTHGEDPFYRWVLPGLSEADASAIGTAWLSFFAQRDPDETCGHGVPLGTYCLECAKHPANDPEPT